MESFGPMNIPNKSNAKVVVAMSGGVDSSVAAALLSQQGCHVVGVTLRVVPEERTGSVFEPCCSLAAAEDARQVAERLGIPHVVLNYVERFENDVIADFLEEYQKGRTPNPCIRCNVHIKFGALWDKARELGAGFLATGHYACIERREGRMTLTRAQHLDKDQSYVLAGLGQEHLEHALFPLGTLPKSETRRLAASLELVTADRPESQEICFVPDDNYRRFLAERIGPFKPGPIVSVTGEILGQHQGLPYYTIGQRRGLGIAAPRPYYVIRLDAQRNAVIVGHEEDTFSAMLVARQVNWCSMAPQEAPFEAEVKIRYRHTPAAATVTPVEGGFRVEFREPQRSVTPGQWAVCYRDDVVLAGGIIEAFGNCEAEL